MCPANRLGRALAGAGFDVLLLDLAPPPALADAPLPSLSFAAADVRDEAALTSHFKGASLVFHLASYGMSGGAQLQRQMVQAVNVGGTCAVLTAAVMAGVGRLVYLSTYNVVYGGQEITGGDESLPYFPYPEGHYDAYSSTKGLAERAVLGANGTPLPGGGTLRTCALRPAGIWGPGEQRHLPRIVRYLEMGLFCFVIGRPEEAIVDWLHVDNLVQGCLLAAVGLTAEKGHIAAGQAYFLHDDHPGVSSQVNQFAFLRPLVEGLGYRHPTAIIPTWAAFYAAWLLEWLHWLLWPLLDISRWFILTRTEVLKSGRTHHMSCAKARRQLGYRPRRHSFQPVVAWFVERGHGRKAGSGRGGLRLAAVLLALLAMILGARLVRSNSSV
ncbi:short-chain dehydrogenase reductase family 42E member 1 isoform B [Chlorella sorokiniana]|uniref:Short-chain dehydrogenase reductase family 42E member 1 isoform B n=1 Tax=Chlorella sorokiniana TaxID=3076 RepID=A0A2P6TBV2_CHLSO|nr:short-chain dehydrogenase reductase family 42E member 1 isoform B [Chlorella sorokiniana]|eukprot:PRW18367.1 short-chain dehydrogenase reductase family 42E member 1 isoform B [Chlorella sorokiniana]